MFEAFEALGAAWRTVAHISEWTGLSVGALVGLGALVYFDPKVLKLAIVGGSVVLLGLAAVTYGHSVGVADEDAKLKTLSADGDARAATSAKADESALVAEIKLKADKQHAEDLAAIDLLKASGAHGCAFDPDGPDSMRDNGPAAGAVPVGRKPKPAAVAKASDKSAPGSTLGRFLHLPLVWGGGVQGQRPAGDAPPNGK